MEFEMAQKDFVILNDGKMKGSWDSVLPDTMQAGEESYFAKWGKRTFRHGT